MKKTQKKLGNKGFSLVELIVVIAIMAVLVGVLAPTLIRNVEKSRESTDLQTLDSIRSSVTTALSTEDVNKAFVSTTNPSGATSASSYTTTLAAISSAGSSGTGLLNTLNAELNDDGVLGATLKSKVCNGKDIKIEISSDGKVTVKVDVAKSATKSKIDMIAE